MGISGISDASSYEEWKLINAQKEQAQEAVKQSGTSRSSQIDSIKASVNQNDIELSDATASSLDTIEISREGRAFLLSSQMENGQKAPVSEASVPETEQSYTNLTALTDEEISDLADDGTITQAEANAELARRAAQEASKDSFSADSGLSNIEEVEY